MLRVRYDSEAIVIRIEKNATRMRHDEKTLRRMRGECRRLRHDFNPIALRSWQECDMSKIKIIWHIQEHQYSLLTLTSFQVVFSWKALSKFSKYWSAHFYINSEIIIIVTVVCVCSTIVAISCHYRVEIMADSRWVFSYSRNIPGALTSHLW